MGMKCVHGRVGARRDGCPILITPYFFKVLKNSVASCTLEKGLETLSSPPVEIV